MGFCSGVPEAVGEAIQFANNYPSALANNLRTKLAVKLSCEEDQLIIGAGSESLLGFCQHFDPEDEIITASATLWGLIFITFIKYPLFNPYSDYRFDIGAIATSVNERTRAVYIANPNNPTGTIITKEELGMLMRSLPEQVMLILTKPMLNLRVKIPFIQILCLL